MNKLFPIASALALFSVILPGCQSSIRPLRPVERVEVWVPEEPLPPATAPATQTADAATLPATMPIGTAATQPGRTIIKVIDPNQTSRFIYNASYDNIWQQAMHLLGRTGFALDRQDYRLGVLTTAPLPSAQIIEFWKPHHTDPKAALENTMHNQRRIVRLTISRVPGKPEFYEIAIQVLVERRNNPTEQIGGPIFVEGSGFGRNPVTLRSDYADPNTPGYRWVPIGHDPELERKLLAELFNRI